MSARSELSSVSAGIDELVKRVSVIADALVAQERDQLGSELFEVERALASAQRRLARALDTNPS